MKFVAIGDSVMWGQGLRDEDKFVVRAAKAIAESMGQLFRREDLLLMAHSGAKIDATPEEYGHYWNEYRFRFPANSTLAQFRASGIIPNDSLIGEVPRAFPTVLDQIKNCPLPSNQQVDVVFVSGGGNDLDFESFMNVRNETLEADQRRIINILSDRYRRMLEAALIKFPQSIIYAIGYYPILSEATDRAALKQMAYDYKNTPADDVAFNEWLQGPDEASLLTSWFWDWIRDMAAEEGAMDVDEYVRKAIQYNVNAYYTASMTMRKVVHELNSPRILYAEPSWSNNQSMFASESHVFEGFSNATATDAAKAMRLQAGLQLYAEFDRQGRLTEKYNAFQQRVRTIVQHEQWLHQNPPNALIPRDEERDRIILEIDRLKRENEAYVASKDLARYHYMEARKQMMPYFSFLHPNAKGANAYFQSIMSRWDALTKPQSLRTHLLPGGGSLRAYRTRFQVKRSNLRNMVSDDLVDMVLIRIKARQGFFWGFDAGFINSVKIHLRRPVGGHGHLLVPSLKASSFGSWVDATSGLPRALDADNEELWGCFPIFANQLNNMVGFDKLRLNNIASIELTGTQLPNVVDFPQMPVGGNIPIVVTDGQMVASRIEVSADHVPLATLTTLPLWKKKNGIHPKVTLAIAP